MSKELKLAVFLIFGIAAAAMLLVSGCASTGAQATQLPVVKGRVELVPGVIDANQIQQPSIEMMASGSAFLFSPVEFPGHKARLGLEEITSPLGQNVAMRQVGEGLLRDIKPGQAKTFRMRYQTTFGSLQQAKTRFPQLPADQFIQVTREGKDTIEVTYWEFRMVLVFSSDRKAFRVLIDNINYYHPTPDQHDESLQETEGKLPVLVSFAYMFPDYTQHTSRQINIVFDYLVDLKAGTFRGKPQSSNWISLQDNAESSPYSIEIAVAEIKEKKTFYLKVPEWIKSIRELF